MSRPPRHAYGEEQPFWKVGPFKVRLPFIHHRIEAPEFIQGFALVAVAMGAIPVIQETLGIPFELALIMVTVNEILYLAHPVLGDPGHAGWITPAIPLVTVWASGFQEGVDRIHAIIALQFCMTVLFIFLGVTGLSSKLINRIPVCIRGGIMYGSGVAALTSVMSTSGRLVGYERSIIVGMIVSFIIFYSVKFAKVKDRVALLRQLGKLGMVPGIIIGMIVGVACGELPAPVIEWGVLPFHRVGEILQGYTVFGIGFPPLSYFVMAIPLAITAYIIAFGDFILTQTVTESAMEFRGDEKIDFDPNRSHIISGLRNLIMGLFFPYAPLCGPLWAGGTIATAERYKQGPDNMESIFSGLTSLIIPVVIGMIFMPIVSIFKPAAQLGLSLTLMVQAFACGYIAMEMLPTKEERGIGAVMGAVLALRGSIWGLVTGFVLYFIIGIIKKPANANDGAETSATTQK